MKNLSIALTIVLSTLTLVGCGNNETKLMRDSYSFDKSVFDYVKANTDLTNDGTVLVTYGTGGRNCDQRWNYENGSIVSKSNPECYNYSTQ